MVAAFLVSNYHFSINQEKTDERGWQVSQMQRIYQNAKAVLAWLGPDTDDHLAVAAIRSILVVSDFLCDKLGIPVADLKKIDNITEVVFKHRGSLPVPDECQFSTETLWQSLIWFYSHSYFTRVWVIQELNANRERIALCGYEKIDWDRVELVAGYIIMETSFSKRWGFTNSYCWWAATTTELKRPENWLSMLYLASNYSTMDDRDVIYGLRGLMKFSKGAEILRPDYHKTTIEVYRDSVEAALVNFENTDVLLYVTGNEDPSWIPRWDKAMLFRNPFRFANPVPWKPAGKSKAIWEINKTSNVLSVTGFTLDPILFTGPYNEKIFGNSAISSNEGRHGLRQTWKTILDAIRYHQSPVVPFSTRIITSIAVSFSFGLNEKSIPEDERSLLHRFVAYLKIVLDADTYDEYIAHDLSEESKDADGLLFGKPIWDFEYPESSFFITKGKLFGCCVSVTRPGDIVWVALGGTYPLILRPDGDSFVIRGFTYVHGVMHGERQDSQEQTYQIR
jgi:hypothetical protein